MVEQGAAPAGLGETHPQAPGQGRTPPGHTRVPCEELADGVDPKGVVPGESWPKARTGPCQTPRWSAERRRTFLVEGAHIRKWTRRSVLHPLGFGRGLRGNDGVPGAAQIIRAHKCALLE